MLITRKAIVGLAALGLAVGLAGCASPLEAIIEQQAGVQIESDGDSFTVESDEGTVQIGAGAELPSGFPADLPLPNGELTASVGTAEGWALTFAGVEPAALEQLEAALRSAGFTETMRMGTADAVQAGYESAEWIVSLIWDGSAGGSKALVYGVAPR